MLIIKFKTYPTCFPTTKDQDMYKTIVLQRICVKCGLFEGST